MTVIITGANGFIGRHLINGLLSHGVTVYAIVREELAEHDNRRGCHFVVGDLGDVKSICGVLPREPDAFFHLAWDGTAPEKRKDPAIQIGNIALGVNAVRLAAAIGAKRFILPGSTMEYAFNSGTPSAVTFPEPYDFFGATKIAVRLMCRRLCQDSGVPFIYVLITGIYGADRNDNNVITYAITQLLAGKRPSFTRLEQLWDYVHIDDVAEALYLIASRGKDDRFYMVGHGDNWPLANYICMIRDMIDPQLPLGIGDIPYKDAKVPSSCVDMTTLREDTGFIPKISFQDGIKTVICAKMSDICAE